MELKHSSWSNAARQASPVREVLDGTADSGRVAESDAESKNHTVKDHQLRQRTKRTKKAEDRLRSSGRPLE